MISDREVILKIKNGEIDAFSYIVKQYTDNMYRYIHTKLFDKAEVDDVVQNIFVNFYKAMYCFDQSKPVLPYLYQIAKNELKMYYRSHKNMLPLDESIAADDDQNNFYKEDYGEVLNSLSKDQKNVFQLLLEGYSYKNIANMVRKPINTVRSIIRRSRLQMKKTYEATGK